MQNQRGFVGVGVLIAIILSVIVFSSGTYFVMQQQPPSQTGSDNFDKMTSPAPVADNTANWKTFINSRDGYSVKYPSEEIAGTPSIDCCLDLSEFGFGKSMSFMRYGGWANIYIFNGSLDQTITAYKKLNSEDRVYDSTENMVIGGKNGKILNWTNKLDSSPRVIRHSYFVEYRPSKTLYIGGSQEFVTTIKFLPLNTSASGSSTSDMSRYTDSSFGFSFYYPQDWQVVKDGNTISVIDPKDFDEDSKYDKHRVWINIKEITGSSLESHGLFSDYTYTYDPNAQQWMYNLNVDCGESGPSCVPQHFSGTAASIAIGTTIGGYPMYPGGASHGSGNTLVPLSNNKMLELATYSTGASSFVLVFAGMITAPNVSVDSTKLNAAIQALVNDPYYQQQINYERSDRRD